MTLIARKETKKFRCLTHQQDFDPEQLSWVVLEEVTRQCPRCVEEMPAKFAQEIGGELGICVIHDKEGVPAVQRCSTCHQAFCGDCMSATDVCVFCLDMPYGTTGTQAHRR